MVRVKKKKGAGDSIWRGRGGIRSEGERCENSGGRKSSGILGRMKRRRDVET
jgi:hypothetical protein